MIVTIISEKVNNNSSSTKEFEMLCIGDDVHTFYLEPVNSLSVRNEIMNVTKRIVGQAGLFIPFSINIRHMQLHTAYHFRYPSLQQQQLASKLLPRSHLQRLPLLPTFLLRVESSILKIVL